ncbi:Septin-domain-containing protein [Mycotypha africana]|uniref:Septin-domain-containing protein n=1 Tax=Mycotypha africana TaxID=64632 RepID=UPI002301E635|nr:Septin-domain-containing protein [Mycotypha africana]KAI8984756.1 Septin-domain-containing protein [Mycotypha africana]
MEVLSPITNNNIKTDMPSEMMAAANNTPATSAYPTFAGDSTGIANLPNQRHKIVAKNGANFTIMVCGESGLGKTTFVNTLFTTTIKEPMNYNKKRAPISTTATAGRSNRTVQIQITRAELEERQFKVKLTIIDTPGFGDYVNNRHGWIPIINFIDDQHENYMRQEQQPCRKGVIDMRVHACLYFVKPTGHTLSPLDIEVMKRLGSRVNLIPVIAKADTLTPNNLAKFKQNIRDVIAAQNIQCYSAPIESDDENSLKRNIDTMAAMPFAVIGSTQDITTPDGRKVKGRGYSWGVAEVENEEHCDFIKLRRVLIRSHMLDLITTTEENHYENYRQIQMETRKFGDPRVERDENAKFAEEEEQLRKSFTEKVRSEENRFRQWEQQLLAERDRLHKELEAQSERIKELQYEIEAYYTNSSSAYQRESPRNNVRR